MVGNKQRNLGRNSELGWDDWEQEVGGRGEAQITRLKDRKEMYISGSLPDYPPHPCPALVRGL